MTRSRSFTLIEMLIALALIVAMVFILMPTASRIMSSTTAASDHNHRLAQIALVSDVLDRAMLTAVAQDAAGRSAFQGSETSLKLTTCGVSLSPREAGTPDDLQTIELVFSGDTLSLRENGGSREIILTGIEKGTFAYNTGEGWAESNDGASGLPGGVAVSIWLRPNELEPVADDAEPDAFEEQDEHEPDWRRVFAVFDPAGASESSQGGGV